jgi:hypothetical protein
MGETRHEIFGIRQGGDHPAGRAIAFGGSTHAGETWHSQIVFSTAGMIGISAADQKPPRIAPSQARSVWNRIPEGIRSQIVEALDQPELSPRELAVRFTDEQEYFVSKTSVYRLLKRTILSPAYIVIQAAEAFKDKTTRPTSSGRPTSPISRSRAEAGTISPPCSTISRASLLPGSSVRL